MWYCTAGCNEDEGIDIEDVSSASVSVSNNDTGAEDDFSDAGRSAVISLHSNQHSASVCHLSYGDFHFLPYSS